ncbi:hypothetical protein GOBAR_AA07490 [Gossypium barbadense]|uniref:Uncharacterized protein n=1 Tax=Gossypium barbadense TaxID=3634 RepID=A0A2P5YC24_GOSBA|nr:hypothetical protein GOBAR_AA07490 [Gossypium barbadense]
MAKGKGNEVGECVPKERGDITELELAPMPWNSWGHRCLPKATLNSGTLSCRTRPPRQNWTVLGSSYFAMTVCHDICKDEFES